MQNKTAFITGITGQDGTYLAEFLLGKGYKVHGLVRWDCVDATKSLQVLEEAEERLELHFGDVTDANNINYLIKDVAPDEIYNLAALSHVKVSFETPSTTIDINAKGTLNILESVRLLNLEKQVRIYQASSSEMFGSAMSPQNEDTKMEPCSPYGVAKLAAYHLAKIYREAYGLHVSNGILFNHESPLRGEDFVTRKITRAVVAIEAGTQDKLVLGNLDSRRDWGHARDYIEGMWLMLQQDVPDDYVLATGESRTVREFVEAAFAHTGVQITWRGFGLDEIGVDSKTGKTLVTIDANFFRPKDVNALLGDSRKAHKVLNWNPKNSFKDLVSDMVNADRGDVWREDATWSKVG
ncbi:MAG: GDP-mannose 4,6-dehydratase [Pseudomonadota bacterium]